MKRKLLILAVLYLFFGVTPAFAAVSFTVSNPQYNGDEIIIDASLSGLTASSCPNNSCYLQAAFTSQEQTRYFGFTKNHSGQWYEYISSPDISYIQSTFFAFQPVSGTWSGQITLKINPESSNYKGPGSYNIKAWRYTGNSTSASGNSDTISVSIVGPTPTPSPTPTPTPSPTPSPTPTKTPSPSPTPKKTTAPTPTATSTPSPTLTPSSTPSPKSTPTPSSRKTEINYRIASVAAVSTESGTPASGSSQIDVKNQKQTNPFFWIGLVFILIGAGSVGYIYLKQNEKLHFPFRR